MIAQYQIRLDGVHARDVSLAVVRDVADLLVEGASRAARLAAEGRSVARGSPPLWLAGASDLRLTGLREGSLTLDVAAQPLAELAPEVFSATTGETAVDLLIAAIDDALHGRRDSERLDLGLLHTLGKAKGLFGRGPTQLRLSRLGGASIEISDAAVDSFHKLATETPAPRIDRVVGVLDSLTMSTRTALVRLEDGAPLKANLAPSIDLDHVKRLLGLDVMFEGTVAFRPSGRPQRIEIDHVDRASPYDAIWRRTPLGELPYAQLALPGDELGRYFGQWPGDESDDELARALRSSISTP